MGGFKKWWLLLVVAGVLSGQTHLLVESFSSSAFPPPGWSVHRSDTIMEYWKRYPTSNVNPDSHHARVLVSKASDSLRTGSSSLITPPLNLSSTPGDESLFFWFRFTNNTQNLGPDDSLFVDAGDSLNGWTTIYRLGQSGQTAAWDTVRLTLTAFNSFDAVRIRFRYEDRPNEHLGSSNRYFWLDSVKVLTYEVGIQDHGSADGRIFERLKIFPNPFSSGVSLSIKVCPARGEEQGDLKIFDRTGRCIREFQLGGSSDSRFNYLHWDGTDQAGYLLPAGSYYLSLFRGKDHEIKTVILIR